MTKTEPINCYLCGLPLNSGQSLNVDHIPPKQILVKEVRKRHPIKFVTRKVHSACNTAYKHDEEYFVHCLVPFARGTEAGDALFRKVVTEYRDGKNRPLVETVLSQAVRKVEGIHLPPSKVALELDRDRFDRVVSKIVRGLHFCDFGWILDPETKMFTSLTPPGEQPPERFLKFMELYNSESHGHHQGVFAYRRYAGHPGVNFWALLFWDRVIVTALFEVSADQLPPHLRTTTSQGPIT